MAVYLYTPPSWRNVRILESQLRAGITTSTVVYRQDGVWFNVHTPGESAPDLSSVDVDDRTGLRLYFSKPMVVPGSLHDELAAITPADPSWTPGSLTLL